MAPHVVSESQELWLWTITGTTWPFKRHKTRFRMTEEDARQRHGDDAQKVEGSLEIRQPIGAASDMMRGVPAKSIGGQDKP